MYFIYKHAHSLQSFVYVKQAFNKSGAWYVEMTQDPVPALV